MKATFKKAYVTSTKFDKANFAKIISDASEGKYVSYIDREQFVIMCSLSDKVSLDEYLVSNSYNLNYYGQDKNSCHIFKIEKENSILELKVLDEYFKIYFKVEKDDIIS